MTRDQDRGQDPCLPDADGTGATLLRYHAHHLALDRHRAGGGHRQHRGQMEDEETMLGLVPGVSLRLDHHLLQFGAADHRLTREVPLEDDRDGILLDRVRLEVGVRQDDFGGLIHSRGCRELGSKGIT